MSETNGAPPLPDNPRGDGKPGRLGNGRFGPGNAFSRGNPLNRRMFHLRAALLAAIDRQTIEAAARELGKQAAAGDLAAIKLLFDYCCGRPPQALEISGPDGEPLGSDRREAIVLEALGEVDPAARLALARKLKELDARG